MESLKHHWQLVLYALQILWGLKRTWPIDRLRLWKKSFNLYLSFLAFTDTKRPFEQLKRAMICAIMSAVYDYDSDWPRGDRKGNNFSSLLPLIQSEEARTIAVKLFQEDVGQQLSKDGLERGSVALRFYWLVINSRWMSHYTAEEINNFGRKLQIIDDALDFESDRLAGDANCFSLTDQIPVFVAEAEEFMKSDFFLSLQRNSWVYRLLEKKVKEKLQNFGVQKVSFGQLFATGRPRTAGLAAFILSFSSFNFYPETPLAVYILTSLAYAGLTMSIMTFNDWVDRDNDCKKGKLFASKHPQELMRYWQQLTGVTLLLVVLLAHWSVPLAIFCAAVLALGILYSYTRKLYIINNLIVAVCSGTPALCGLVFHGKIKWVALCTFGLFASLIFISELYKDVEDRKVDLEYKITVPTRKGDFLTIFGAILLLYIPAIFIVLHPNHWIRVFGGACVVLLMFKQASVLLEPELIYRPQLAMKLTLKVILVILLFT